MTEEEREGRRKGGGGQREGERREGEGERRERGRETKERERREGEKEVDCICGLPFKRIMEQNHTALMTQRTKRVNVDPTCSSSVD